jgi:hypothetical protein
MPTLNTTFNSVAWNGTVFCAVSSTTYNVVVTSPDGITWTLRYLPQATSGASATPESPCYVASNGTLLLVYINGSNIAFSSSDGVVWTPRTMPFILVGQPSSAVGNGSGKFVTFPSNDNRTWASSINASYLEIPQVCDAYIASAVVYP